MPMMFGTGHILEADDGYPHVLELVGGAPSASRPVDHVDAIFNQGSSSSCVGAALAMAVYLRSRTAGAPIAMPSPLAIYAYARYHATGRAVADEGCRPGDAVDAMAVQGLTAYDRWPYGSPVNSLPPWDVAQHAHDARIGGVYTLDGGDRDAIKRALDAGYPVAWAQTVDDAFENYKSGVLGVYDGANHGSHYTVIVDYDADGVRAVNSWGAYGEPVGTCASGSYRASWDRVAQGRNFRVVNTAPSGVT